MSHLSENHQRKILATFQYVDRLLEESLRILNSSNSSPLSVYQSDLSEPEANHLLSCVEQLRAQMMALLDRFQVGNSSSKVFASWAMMTNLRTIAMAFNELYAKNMRGHGKLDSDIARDLDGAVSELIRSADQLRNILSASKSSGRTAGP